MPYPPRFTRALIALPALLGVAAAGCKRAPEITAEPESLPGIAELQAREPHPDAPPVAACGSEPWTTYGHDAARTSASGGCLVGPLKLSWSFAPRSSTGATSFATRAVADEQGVYVAGALGPIPTLWRVSASSGKPAWSYDTRTESVRGGWPTLAGDRVYLVDDGVNVADAATGVGHRAELDAWGECLSDGKHLFAENDWYLDGYGLYLSAFDLDLKLLWRRDYNALAKGVMVPDVGGLALDEGLLVHAAQHGPLTGSGVAAFDPETGERKWRAAVSPQSSPSLGGGRVFVVERWPGEHVDRLVARQLADGTLVWARPVANARGPAPVLAGHLVLVHAKDGVAAFERATGEPVWTSPVPRTAPDTQSATTLAAAMGSSTVAALSGGKVHVLRLADGAELWAGSPAPHAREIEAPVVVDHSLYVVADGHVLRLDGSDAR